MKEVKITIIGDNNSNTTKEFKGDEALKLAANYFNNLVGEPKKEVDKKEVKKDKK